MPYSIPAPTPAPLPIHSQGRPGHRRSFSEMAYNGFGGNYSTQGFNGSAMRSTPVAPPMRRESSSGAFEPLRLPARRKTPSFHLEADDDDDSSPEDEEGTNGGITNNTPSPSAAAVRLPPPTPHHRRVSPNSSSATLALGGVRPTQPGRPSTPQLRDDDDDEFARPGLPPLKLKIPSNGSLNLPFAGSPTRSASPALPNVPFPKASSPSPPRSRSGSMENLSSLAAPAVQIKAPSPLSAPPTSVAFPSTGSGANTPTRSESPRPQFPRTASTPSFLGSHGMQRTLSNSSVTSTNEGLIILSNGRPLKSSLKSSSSSPNIPFPSQSLVPSRIYAEIAAAQAREREEQARAGTPTQETQGDHLRFTGYPDVPLSNRHARAASAPALPSLLNNDDSTPNSPLDSMPQTPSAPKAVHFPESDDVATIKFFRRSARPASVSLPGASGDEGTETETDGEGYGSSTGTGGWGSGNTNSNNSSGTYKGYNANTSWGWGGYVNPWDRYTAAGSARQQGPAPQGKGPGGYPFPRIAPPTRATPGKVPGTVQGAKKEMNVQKKRVYRLDKEKTSVMPKRELGLFENVFLEGVELSSTSPVESSSSSSAESEEKKTQVTLTGSLLVRNLAYEKHVSVRFTLDEWHTTSEVKASYKESIERLPERWVGVMRGDPSLADDTTRPQTLPPSSKPTVNPQWDRFTFTIDLSDYARSRSLANRTMWMVLRFATPGVVRVPIAVPLRSSAFNVSSTSTSSGKPGSHLPQADVLGPSDGNMLSTIISGVAGAPHHSTAAQEKYMKGRETVEELLRKRSICVGVGVGSEWWDNNAGGNFRVGFTEKEEIIGGLDPVPAAEASEHKEADDEKGVQGRKRANVVSCPPLFGSTPPPPMSILGTSLSHSALSPPQISVSTSLDSSSNPTPPAALPNGTIPGINSTSAPSTPYMGGPTTNNGTPNPWPTRTPAANKALAETTLERLKRLNLRNYAAPTAPARPAPLIVPVPQPKPALNGNSLSVPNGDAKADGPPSRTSSTSSTSSWSSSNSSSSGSEVTPMTSPLVTPTIGGILDEMTWLHDGTNGASDEKSKAAVEEKEDVLDDVEPVGRATPRPTSIAIPPPSVNPSNPNATLSPLPISPLPGQEVPGSPSASSSLDAALGAMTTPIPIFGNFMNGPSGAFAGEVAGGDSGMSAAMMGSSPPFSSLLTSQSGFGWAQKLAAQEKAGEEKKQEQERKVDGDATPMPVVTSGPLPSKLLDNIREKSTSGRRPGSGQNSPVRSPSPTEKPRAVSAPTSLPGKAGSGSDSGSSATARSGSGSGGSVSSGGGHKKRPHQHRPDSHGLGLTFRSPTSPAASPSISSFSSPFAPPKRSSPPGPLSPFAGMSAIPPVPVTSPMSPSGPTSVAGRNSLDEIRDPDSIYQAFVKQWCFASGPAPAQAGGFGTMNGTRDKKGL